MFSVWTWIAGNISHVSCLGSYLGLIHTASRAESMWTWPDRAEPVRASDYTHCKPSRAKLNLTGPSWTGPSEWLFTSQTEPSQAEPDRTQLNRAERVTIHIASWAEPSWTWLDRAEPGQASDYSHWKPIRPELKAMQLTFQNCEDVKPNACIFINGQ